MMRLFGILLCGAVGCAGDFSEPSRATSTSSSARRDSSSGTASGILAPLFNGKDLSGWKVDDKAKDHWQGDNGVLHYDGKGEAKDNSVRYEYRLSNVVFAVDFRFPEEDGKPCEFRVGQVFRKRSGSGTDRGSSASRSAGPEDGEEDLYTFVISPDGKWTFTDGYRGEVGLKPAGEWNKLAGSMDELGGKSECGITLNGKEVIGRGHSEAPGGNFIMILRPQGDMDFRNISARKLK
jgi:hypothetical protein